MDLDKEAEKFGLKDKPIELVFETDGRVEDVTATCTYCGYTESREVTVFVADYTIEDIQADLLGGHYAFECPAWKWRVRRWRWQLDRKVLRLFNRKRTPWGIKHIDWRPNVKR